MTTQRKSPWRQKPSCKCIKAELPKAGPIVIRCQEHRGELTKSGREVCYWDADGIVRREAPPDAIEQTRALRGVQQVYFSRLGSLIKIGISEDPERRARELNATLLGSVQGDREVEKKMHRKFADQHEHKEWYRAEGELLDYVTEMFH